MTVRRCAILGEIVVASVPTFQPTNTAGMNTIRGGMKQSRACAFHSRHQNTNRGSIAIAQLVCGRRESTGLVNKNTNSYVKYCFILNNVSVCYITYF